MKSLNRNDINILNVNKGLAKQMRRARTDGIFFSIVNLGARYDPLWKSIKGEYAIVAIQPNEGATLVQISCVLFLNSQVYKIASTHFTTVPDESFSYLYGSLYFPMTKIPSQKTEGLFEVNVIFERGLGYEFSRREIVFQYGG